MKKVSSSSKQQQLRQQQQQQAPRRTSSLPPFPTIQPTAMTPSPDFSRGSDCSALSLSELPEEEKAKVARLVERLVTLATEHEQLLQALAVERAQRGSDIQRVVDQFREEMKSIKDQCDVERLDRAAAQNKLAIAVGLLTLYQERVGLLSEQRAQFERAMIEAQEKVRLLDVHVESKQNQINELHARLVTSAAELNTAKDESSNRSSRASLLEGQVAELQAQLKDVSSQLKLSEAKCVQLSQSNIDQSATIEAKDAAIELAESGQRLQEERSRLQLEDEKKEIEEQWKLNFTDLEGRLKLLQTEMNEQEAQHAREKEHLEYRLIQQQNELVSKQVNEKYREQDELSESSIRALRPPHQSISTNNTPNRSSRNHSQSSISRIPMYSAPMKEDTSALDWWQGPEPDARVSSEILSSASFPPNSSVTATGLLIELVEKTSSMESRVRAMGVKLDKNLKAVESSPESSLQINTKKLKKKKGKKGEDNNCEDVGSIKLGVKSKVTAKVNISERLANDENSWARQREKRESIPFIIARPLTKRLQSSNTAQEASKYSNAPALPFDDRRRVSRDPTQDYRESVDVRYDQSLVELVNDIDPDSFW
jgi:hypothetical protein